MSGTLKALLHALVREEIGRNLKKGERIDFTPWSTEQRKIAIFPDVSTGQYWAEIYGDEGDLRKLLPTEDEANHWARSTWDLLQRKKNATDGTR